MIKPVTPANSFVMGKHRIYMLPTRYGVVFAILVFIILLASINYGNGMGYGLSFLLAAIGFMSMLYTHRNLLHVKVAAGPCRPVFAGEVARFKINLSADDKNNRVGIELMQNKMPVQQLDLMPGESRQLLLSAPTHSRGYIKAPHFRLLTRFPFGLVYTWCRDMPLDSSCLVYPRPADHFNIESLYAENDQHMQSLSHQGDEFYGLREFSQGDSPRRIHWRASARSHNLVIKQYGRETGSLVWLDWNGTTGDTESRLSQLCRGVLDSESAGISYGLRLPAVEILPANGQQHQHACLKALACYGAA